MSEYIELDPNALSMKDKYKLLIGAIVPRPIAFVSTLSKEGVANLSPFSFFNGVSSDPPCLMISTTYRSSDGEKKDTARNIEATNEFVVNVVTEEIVGPMNQTSAEYAQDISEFKKAGLSQAPSKIIKAPRVAESPINLECKLYQTLNIGNPGPGSSILFIGEIVYYHIREDIYQDGRILTEKLKPVGRLAGTTYCPIREIFNIPRPIIEEADQVKSL